MLWNIGSPEFGRPVYPDQPFTMMPISNVPLYIGEIHFRGDFSDIAARCVDLDPDGGPVEWSTDDVPSLGGIFKIQAAAAGVVDLSVD
ncbi:hypothetical protein [Nocardia sp. alder85J]|uniref:hypothetical protein n=1 Tax=Nocardia sp. alder85J TaxID=2862949 RepID=UPI001CD29E8A|nr:hypothetical protein [Nocardia sp. alder85J]MCX4096911.1 hypothetical protein [Nocardia sp. alder85J]